MVFSALLLSCGNADKKSGKVVTLSQAESIFQQGLTSKDTAEVLSLATDFMEKLKSGETDSALRMIRIVAESGLDTLNDNQLESYRKRFGLYPVKDYKLDYYSFSLEHNNDVKFMYEFTGSEKKAFMGLMLNPVKAGDVWILTMKDLNGYSKEQLKQPHPETVYYVED